MDVTLRGEVGEIFGEPSRVSGRVKSPCLHPAAYAARLAKQCAATR
jgi:hypothetical protein